ncbi:MAG: hypothetical protein ACRC8Y_15515 [Chroococcales cyanobacterium]
MKRDNDSKSLLRTQIRERQQVVTTNFGGASGWTGGCGGGKI